MRQFLDLTDPVVVWIAHRHCDDLSWWRGLRRDERRDVFSILACLVAWYTAVVLL